MNLSILFISFLLFSVVSLNIAFAADTPLQLSVDGRREIIDSSCSGAGCSPFSNCITWLSDTSAPVDYLLHHYTEGRPSPIPLSTPILSDAVAPNGVTYYQPWPGQIASTSGLTWRGRSTAQVVQGQPFIIGTLGHRNFAIVTYNNSGSLRIPICNYFTFRVTFKITDLVNPTNTYTHTITLQLQAEETPNWGCSELYDLSIVGNDEPSPWYPTANTPTAGVGKCPYGPTCEEKCSTNDQGQQVCDTCSCGNGCNDRITIPQTGLTDGVTFTFGGNKYFLALMGFTRTAGEPPIQAFTTLEGTDNTAFLYARIYQACETAADCSDGISCSAATCVDHTNEALNPENFPVDFCSFSYDDTKCNAGGCATGKCGPTGCVYTPVNANCENLLHPNAVCKTATCDFSNGQYSCNVRDVDGGCDNFAIANGCQAFCTSNGLCSCPPTPTTTSTTTTSSSSTSSTSTCGDPCGLCNVPNGFTADCSQCPNNPGFKNICVYNHNGGWNLVLNVPNDQVASFFDTTLEQQQNYFPGDDHLDLDWVTIVPSTCECEHVPTTTTTTTPTPRSPPIQPKLWCTSCFADTDTCFATLGYDARDVWPDPNTDDSLVVTRFRGSNNYFTKNGGTTQLDLGQPDTFLRANIPTAAIIEFDSSDTLTWFLDGMSVSISASGALSCDKCEVPAIITVNPFASATTIGASYSIDFSQRGEFCSSDEPGLTHFVVDVPLCPEVKLRVIPDSCTRLDQSGAFPGYVPNAGWDPSATDPECFLSSTDPIFYSPFSVPLFDTPECQSITIELSIDTAKCPRTTLGLTPVSSLYDASCPGCPSCKSAVLLGIASTCIPESCPPGKYFRTDICECDVCSPSTLNCPPFWYPSLNKCQCLKCPATCPDGQYLDPEKCCQPCETVTCDEICDPPVTVCPFQQSPSSDLCGCEPCPAPECIPGTELDITGCGCQPCLVDGCPAGEIPSECNCIPVNVTEPPPNNPCPSGEIDICGVCDGDGKSCLGCDGQPGTGRWIDSCRVPCGDGSSCPSCINDNCAVCTLPVDICGICGGNGSTCLGCDGLPPTLTRPAKQYDWCGVCDGNGTSCLGCGGVPFADPCPTGITPGAAAAVASLSALAALSALALAALLFRLRKRPELLYQAWDNTLRDYITEIESNPLYSQQDQEHNPLFNATSI